MTTAVKAKLALAAVATAVTWVFFDIETPNAPLGPAATTAAMGVWLVVIFCATWVLSKLTRQQLVLIVALGCTAGLNASACSSTPASRPPPPPPPVPTPATSPPPPPARSGVEARGGGGRGGGARPPVLDTGYALLLTGAHEEAGFGLYSYLLFGAPPSTAERPRFAAALTAARQMTTGIGELDGVIDRSQLNVLYFPTQPTISTHGGTSASPDALLDAYDFARASRILSWVEPGVRATGPFIVSALQPIDAVSGAGNGHLWMDLSGVPADVMPQFIAEFKRQALKPDFWKPDHMDQLVLAVRTDLELLGGSVSDVKLALETFTVIWKHD